MHEHDVEALLIEDVEELLIEEVSIDGMCGSTDRPRPLTRPARAGGADRGADYDPAVSRLTHPAADAAIGAAHFAAQLVCL